MNTLSCTPSQALVALEAAYHARIPVYIEGSSGIGKTSIIEQLAQRVGARFLKPLILTSMEAIDLRGVLQPNHESKTSEWYKPDFFPFDLKEGEPAIQLVDELPNAHPTLQTPCYQFFLEHRIGPHEFPKSMWICAAGNSADDRAQLFELQRPLLKRCIVLKMIPYIEDTLKYAMDNDWAVEVMAFLKAKPDYLDVSTMINVNPEDRITPDPRAWEKVSDLIKRYKTGHRALDHLIPGKVGAAAHAEFNLTLREINQLPDIPTLMKQERRLDILNMLPNTVDGLYGLVYALQAHCTNLEQYRRALYILQYIEELEELPVRSDVLRGVMCVMFDSILNKRVATPPELATVPELRRYFQEFRAERLDTTV